MIELPDFEKAFEFENNFYLSCDNSRVAKFVAQYELFKISVNVPGEIAEFGVFKGVSLVRFAHFREILGISEKKSIFGFDTFGEFPDSNYEPDNERLAKFIVSAGSTSIGKDQLIKVLNKKGLDKGVHLIEGDVRDTIPEFIKNNPGVKISFLNLDVDLYEPSKAILESFWPLISEGGVLLLDDYGKFPGETKAADDFFADKGVAIRKLKYAASPSYIIKESQE